MVIPLIFFAGEHIIDVVMAGAQTPDHLRGRQAFLAQAQDIGAPPGAAGTSRVSSNSWQNIRAISAASLPAICAKLAESGSGTLSTPVQY
jgi:hypothetical protein